MEGKQRMVSPYGEASGKDENDLIARLLEIINTNRALRSVLASASTAKYPRSQAESEARKILDILGYDKKYSLFEISDILFDHIIPKYCNENIVLSPLGLLDSIPPGQGVRGISEYIESIIKKAKKEIIILSPFWDINTLIDMLSCATRQASQAELILLLVVQGNRRPNLIKVIDRLQACWPSTKIALFLHLTKYNEHNFPHAKCLIVDQICGYLGSANFTHHGMKENIEIGLSIGRDNAQTLRRILKLLLSKEGPFTLAWDSSITQVIK